MRAAGNRWRGCLAIPLCGIAGAQAGAQAGSEWRIAGGQAGASSRSPILGRRGRGRTGGAVFGPVLHPDEHRMGDVDEVRDPAHQVLFVLVEGAVGVGDPPQQLHDVRLLLVVEPPVEGSA